MSTSKTILFLGATGGCGFGALQRSLAAGHTCIALCRTPAKLSEKLASSPGQNNLRLEQGNAHDADAVLRCLAKPADPSALVDAIVFAIGGAFSMTKMNLDDPNVCEAGTRALLTALTKARTEWGMVGKPRLAVVSTQGISEHGRDYPIALLPLYHMLKVPHEDKRVMESLLVASDEAWTIVRPSLLVDGDSEEEKDKPKKVKNIREGIEDPKTHKVDSKVVGYAIHRDAVGRWIFDSVLSETSDRLVGKIATITF